MFIFDRGTFNTLEILSGKSQTFPFNFFGASSLWPFFPSIRRSKKVNCMSQCTEMYRRTISKVIWVGTGALDAILSQIKKKIEDRFHFQWHRRIVNYQFSNCVTGKVNGSRVQPSFELFFRWLSFRPNFTTFTLHLSSFSKFNALKRQ